MILWPKGLKSWSNGLLSPQIPGSFPLYVWVKQHIDPLINSAKYLCIMSLTREKQQELKSMARISNRKICYQRFAKGILGKAGDFSPCFIYHIILFSSK